ncbi:putative ABC transporter permease [Treponema sp.]|uniref:putative ABC transporter permease n=1 Tax=Treponema sp. TaxID=166 RepID=UPI00298E992C|nr:putative ABC transporter permease [Treponema sp.]MCR5612656.1 putative ABC transporter permease [Treponema sp.]
MIQPIYTYSIQYAFLIFISFSFIGWCAEVLYVGIFFEHKFVNRGFLHGPICPVYGFGGVAILCLPANILSLWVPLFFASMIFATTVEYLASWILEKAFHTLWWDYSDLKFNIHGRVCLLNSLLFGAMGILVVHFAEPLILNIISLLKGNWLFVVSHCIAIILGCDILITVRRLIDFNVAMEKLSAIHNSHIEKFQDINKNVEFFLKKFPTLKNAQYKDVIAHLKQKLKERTKRA